MGGGISPGQKWLQTVLKTRVVCSQWHAQYALMRGSEFPLFGEEGGGKNFFFFLFLGCCHAINPGPKWWQTVFANKSSMQPMKGSAWTNEGPSFFSFFLCLHDVPYVFLWCSQRIPQVLNLFHKAFPIIAPHFYPICFAQSSTLMYINWNSEL